jgi:ABC-type Mn2+/Zn2+ transport system ATPase subunit
MSFSFSIPTTGPDPLRLELSKGQTLFLVGANGTGKSSLMHQLYTPNQGNSRRISAHRQTWFESNTLAFSPEQRRQTEAHVRSYDSNAQSRWRDNYSSQRASIAIYDLIDAENVRARSIAKAVDGGDIDKARQLSKQQAPLNRINDLLRLSNIPVEISVQANEQVLASRRGSPTYSVAELSDGERNALIIAANVLTVPPGTLVLIDEPERHLHRSIISPLLTLLFAQRPDCAFIVSTHDVMLPIDNPSARTLLVRGCHYEGSTARYWDVDLLAPSGDIDEALKFDILGSRRKILFVEGGQQSLDAPLYALLFPNTSVVAKHSCRDVMHAVNGIRASATLHWLQAFGLIDNDRRSAEDIADLKSQGIYSLSMFSVESVYYHPSVQRRLAERLQALTGRPATEALQSALHSAIESIRPHAGRLARRGIERLLRLELERKMPKSGDIEALGVYSVQVDIGAKLTQEQQSIEARLSSADLAGLLQLYPLRETPALQEIAKNIGFQNRSQYEEAVRKLMLDSPDAVSEAHHWFGELARELT